MTEFEDFSGFENSSFLL